MNAARFHNALRIMGSIDRHELVAAGVIDENWGEPEASPRDQVSVFMEDPFREALRMPDDNFERLFALIESRQPVASAAETAVEIKAIAALANVTGEFRRVLELTGWSRDPAITVSLRNAARVLGPGEDVEARP